MTSNNLHWQKNIWSVIDNYFTTNKNYISQNQLDSYNIFLKNQIPKTIRQFNPMIFTKGEHKYYDTTDIEQSHYIHKIEFIIGGSLSEDGESVYNDGKGIYLSKPIIQELVKNPIRISNKIKKKTGQTEATKDEGSKSDEVEDLEEGEELKEIIKDVRVKQLFPNEARLKNLTYSTLISCDIFIIITNVKIENNKPVLYKGPVQIHKHIPLGNIPIMVKSNLCVLSNMPRPILYEMGECIYDQGGYFIINGKEKVIINQERQVENRLYIQENKVDPNIQYELNIRSVPENIFQPARITSLYMVKEKEGEKQTNAIYVKIPHCNGYEIRHKKNKKLNNYDVPLFLLFRALGVVSDKDIVESIIDINKSDLSKATMDILKSSIDELYERKKTFTQHDALLELSEYINVPNKKILPSDDMKLIMLQDILRNYFIPHVGKMFKEKSIFLSHMVKELILVKLGIRDITDKDNFMNKRVDTSGYLIGTIFRDLYFRVKNNLRDNLNRSYSSVKPTLEEADVEWSKALGDVENNRTLLDNFIGGTTSVTSIIKINDLFQQHIMNDGFLYAFKNCWGLKNARGCKQGIVQDLNRLSYLGYLSHLRRLNTSIPSGAKIRAPHSLNSSTFGIICPSETPDGGNIGLRKNLAITAKITFGTNSDSFMKLLHSLKMVSIYDIAKKNTNTFTKIFLNEKILGYHEYPKHLCYMLRLYKRNALINIYTSISWYIIDNIIKISTTSGRCCRPLLVVKDNACLLTDKYIDDIKEGTINWKHLIGGTRTLDMNTKQSKQIEPYIDDNNLLIDFDKKNYKYVQSKELSLQECLEHYGGVIEYVDTEEANNSLIALTPHDLKNSNLSHYTYCEIHPTMLFGIIANNIPLLERNQAPRNQFATVHGKQALGVYATNFKNRMDTKVQVMFYPQKPIIQSVYSKYLFTDQIPHGINAIVAVACYGGYNQEDSLIFNKSSIERGLFRTVKFRTYSEREEINNSGKNKEEICFPDERFTRGMKLGNYSKLDKKTGIIPENTHVTDSDIVVGKVMYTGEKDINGNKLYSDNSLIVKRHESGIIDKIHYNTGNDEQNYIKLRLRKDKIPEIGDKFCSRFGQKGTIGMVLPTEDMPFTKNGIVPDIIMNPHALPSRMTLGQILEVIMGKVSVESGKIAKLSSFSNINEPLIGEILEELGYEKCANEVLYNGMNGKQIKVNIFMGPTYYQRLVHQVADKMNSRTSGPQTSLAHQPVGGRSIGGGLRIGEMERDSLLAHGVSYFIKESFMERSDKYSFYISNKSGLLAIVNTEKKIFEDFSKDETKIKVNREGNIQKFSNKVSDADFICIEAPYTFKLFLQEIESMGVALRLVTSDVFTQWEYLTDGKIKVKDTFLLEDGDEDVHNIIDTKVESVDTITQYYTGKTTNISRPLNKFHNKIKEVLLDNKSNNLCNITDTHKSLLDTSIGRGGDLWKWFNYNYTTILGFDIDTMGIENMGDSLGGDGAKKRLQDMKKTGTEEQKKWARQSKIYFAVADTSNDIRKLENIDDNYVSTVREAYRYMPEHSFDTVSSQFTIHYYFENEIKIKQYLQNVQTNIKKNGYLLVTCLDGESVYELLKRHNKKTGQTSYDGILNDPVKGNIKVWGINGSELDMTRDTLSKDTFNEVIKVYYESIGHEQKEYLVHKEHLVQLASTYDLFLLSDTEAQTNFNILQHGSDMFKKMYDPIKNRHKRNKHIQSLGYFKNKNLKMYSNLHRYYVFKYIPDLSEEQKGLLLNQSLEMLTQTQDIKPNPYVIKYSYMPEHLMDSFTKPIKLWKSAQWTKTTTDFKQPPTIQETIIKHRLEERHNGSIIVYEDVVLIKKQLEQKEQELKESGLIDQSRNQESITNTELLLYNLEKQEKYEESLNFCVELIKILDSELGKGHSKVKELMKHKYSVLIQLERYEESIAIINELLTLIESIDLTTEIPQFASQVRKDKAVFHSYLAYNNYKLNNIEKSTEIYDELNKNIHKIFNTKEIELYEIQIRECEMLLSRSANYITTHNKLITIIEDIHREIHDKKIKYMLLEKSFSLLYTESKEFITLNNITYHKMAIIAKKQAIPNICLDISKFRQDNVIDKDHMISFGVVIPYYDDSEEITYVQSGGSDLGNTEDVLPEVDLSEEQQEQPTIPEKKLETLSPYNIVIKPDSNISKLIKNVEELYENELELGACSIYIVKQTKKEIGLNKELYHPNSFYDINEEQTMGFLKYNKGALINAGYKLAKKDNKKYMIIMNSDLLYDKSFNPLMVQYPNQPEFIGRLKHTTNFDTYKLDIIKIKLDNYEKINGSPNDIWDPSMFDKILYNRIKNTTLKATSSYVHKTDERIQLHNDNTYEHSIEYRRNEDYLYLDKLSRHFSGLNQLHEVQTLYNIEVSRNIKLIDTDFTLETKPFETYELDEESGIYINSIYSIFEKLDISQSPKKIVSDIIINIIKLNIGIEDIDTEVPLDIIKINMNKHLYNNIFKSLYFENRLKYILNKLSYTFTVLHDTLLSKNINTLSFDNYDSIFRMEYIYNPSIGFDIYMYEDYVYQPEYKHIVDKIYEHRNQIDMLKEKYNNTTGDMQSAVDALSQSDNLQLLDIIQNNVIYIDTTSQTLQYYIIRTNGEGTGNITYSLEKGDVEEQTDEEEQSRFNLVISKTIKKDVSEGEEEIEDTQTDASVMFMYVKNYNRFYYYLKENIDTKYTNKFNIPIFSEQMPKEFFSESKTFDGLQFGYKENMSALDTPTKHMLKKSYRLGIIYNHSSNFVIKNNSTENIDIIKQDIDKIDQETFCESNTKAKEMRERIATLYKNILQYSHYIIEPIPEPVLESVPESIEDVDEKVVEESIQESEKLYQPEKLLQSEEGTQSSTSLKGGYSNEKDYFSIENMNMIQKGGNKNNVIGVRKKILYLLKGLPVKYIKQFQFDVEALYSVTKYVYSNRISKLLLKLKGIDHTSSILECMSCVGGNSISFLQYFDNCVFVEKDPNKVDMLTNNINSLSTHISKKIGNFSVINGDIQTLLADRKNNVLNQSFDIVFIDPPWGGKHYKYDKNIKIKIDNQPLFECIHSFKDMTRYVVLKLPFNYDMGHLKLKLNNDCNIIHTHDIKNSKDKIKMKIIIVEISKSNIFSTNNIINNIKKLSTIQDKNHRSGMNIELEIDTTSDKDTVEKIDPIDESILNLKDNMIKTDSLHVPDSTYKHITIRNIPGHSSVNKFLHNEEHDDHDDHEDHTEHEETNECRDISVEPIEEDIKSINNGFSQPQQKVRRIRIIKEH